MYAYIIIFFFAIAAAASFLNPKFSFMVLISLRANELVNI